MNTSLADRDQDLLPSEEILNDGRTALPKAVPSMAIIIGFLGTVLGLLFAVFAMQDMFNKIIVARMHSTN